MTLRLSAIISADASNALKALDATSAGTKEVKADLAAMGQQAERTDAVLSAAAQQRIAQQRAEAAQQKALRGEYNLSGQTVGNLAAQFNDIGVMLAAGQNPLQLAIQQGTQITQVIGPMGAAGAMRALGSALVSMLSPVNLVTLGVIALGATAVQAFMDAGEAAVSLSDRLSDMTDSVEAFRSATESAALPWRELVSEFGSADPILRATLQDLAGIEKIKAFESINATAASLREMVTAASMFDDSTPNTLAQRFLGFERNSQLARNQAQAFLSSLGDLNSPDQSDQLRGALDLRDRLSNAAGGYSQMNAEQRQFYEGLSEVILQLQAMGVTIDDSAASAQGLTAAQIAGYEVMARTRLEAESVTAAFASQLDELQQQAAIKALIAQFGEDSVQVAQARLAAERAAYEQSLASVGFSEQQRDALMAAWDAANGIAGAGMAANIGAASAEAVRLAQNLGISLDVAQRLAAAQARAKNPDPVIFDPRDPRYDPIAAEQARILADPNRGRTQASLTVGSKGGAGAGAGSGGGGGGPDAVQGLIDRYQQELDLLREMDPVQEQMIRNRAALAEATQPQRQAVEALITTLQREKDLSETRAAQADGLNSYFMRVGQGANAAQTAIDMFLDSALKAVIQGEGPLAGLFGTKGSSLGDLLLGGIFGGGKGTGTLGLPMFGFADGGMLYGMGGGRDDRIPVWKSSGEFTVNARATARNRGLLEFLNGGGDLGLPRFAEGGMIGGGRGAVAMAPAAAGPTFSIDARGSSDPAEVERAAERGMRAALTEYSRSGLPRDLQRIQANPMRIG